MTQTTSGKPASSEYPAFYARYIDLVEGEDITAILARQIEANLPTLRAVSEEQSLYRYDRGKWSLREVIGHMIDCERIFAYRALRFARNDKTEVARFEQDKYVSEAHFDGRSWRDLREELEIVRRSTLCLFRTFSPEVWSRSGMFQNTETTARAVAYALAGHELHHMRIIRINYLGKKE